jgi:hypothetical protein
MKKTLLKLLPLIVIVFLNISCSKSDDGNIPYASDGANPGQNEVLNAKLRINEDVFNTINTNRTNKITKGEAYSINNVKRVGDFLQINLSYSGGCKLHDFEIIWDGIVYTDEPCHMNLLLIHNANNDTCEALITGTIVVNLEELIGDVIYKDHCAYHIYSTYNSSEFSDVVIEGIN